MGRTSRVFGQQGPPPGVYRDDPDRDDAASQSSAMSLHEGIEFHESDEPLPPYSDDPASSAFPTPPSEPEGLHTVLDDVQVNPDGQLIYKKDKKGATETWLSPTLSTDPKELQKFVNFQTKRPPRAYIWLHGEHTESSGNGKDKKKEKKIDFDIMFNVTDTIAREKRNERGEVAVPGWSSVSTVDPVLKTYRGSILKKTGWKGTPDGEAAPEAAPLEEWCHLFCASSSKLKSFTIRHMITNRNDAILKEKIESVIRSTNYRGHITIGFQLLPRTITIQTPHAFNRLRHNKFFYWFCIIFQLWIITWPILFFMTKRWAIAFVSWPYKMAHRVEGDASRVRWESVRYSEQEWVQKYRYTIQQGVLSRAVNGTVIDFMPQDEEFHEEERLRMERERQAREAEPQDGFLGGALTLMRGVSNIVRENNSIRGWGYDT